MCLALDELTMVRFHLCSREGIVELYGRAICHSHQNATNSLRLDPDDKPLTHRHSIHRARRTHACSMVHSRIRMTFPLGRLPPPAT